LTFPLLTIDFEARSGKGLDRFYKKRKWQTRYGVVEAKKALEA
jgi:hypothetical protein